MQKYRLSLDVGTNSIGWCVMPLREDGPYTITDAGVRIYSDGRNPKDGSSNAAARRAARSMRRNRDRFIQRRENLIRALVECGLMPEDVRARRSLTALDPYELRARGIDSRLSLHEFGRALFHLNQRRGFKSNRKSDSGDKEAGVIKTAIRLQSDAMKASGSRTFGEYLHRMRVEGQPVRSRLKSQRITDEKGKEKSVDFYEFYPSRPLIEEEFDTLWTEQSRHYPDILTFELRERIRHRIFHQRPLKSPPMGKCTFERSEDRCAKALPIVQQFRIYQELNNLQILDRKSLKGQPLTLEQRDRLAKLLLRPTGKKSGEAEVSFDKMRAHLGLGDSTCFSHESDKRKGFASDTTAALMSHKERFGARWFELTPDEQENIVAAVLFEDDEEALVHMLMEDWKLSRAQAEAVSTTPLPVGYGRLGVTATWKITEELKKDVITYSEAVVRAGYASHSAFPQGQRHERLPYYGEILERHVIPDPEKAGDPRAPREKRFGKVGNPTVHIAMNQLRKVVNEVIKLHGAPAEIHLEVLRDLKNSVAKKREIEAEQKKNQDENTRLAQRLRDEFNVKVNRENIERLKLWGELGAPDQICVYTGEKIGASVLFTKEVEIDHILPFSRTLDDSLANKLLCKARSNREKTNGTPFEAWGTSPKWQEILDRSAVLPRNKRWRFAADAMSQYLKDQDFLARQLTDSQYIARLAREYLAALFPPDQAHKVVCLPGRLTGLFRKYLQLGTILDELNPSRADVQGTVGEKNRNDHRHHALDAIVIGVMDRAFLQKAASAHAKAEMQGLNKLMSEWQDPWPNFRTDAMEALKRIVVSHKTDHGIEAALHNATAYGISKHEDPRGNAIRRVPVEAIGITNLLNIRGKRLRAELLAHLSGKDFRDCWQRLEEMDAMGGRGSRLLDGLVPAEDKSFAQSAAEFFEKKRMRRIRIIERVDIVIPKEQPFKGFKPDGNAYLEILQHPEANKWEENIVTLFDANAYKIGLRQPQPLPAKTRRIARLFNGDMLEIEHEGQRKVCFIQKMSTGMIALAEHFEANADKRNRDKSDPFKFVYKSVESLRKSKVRFLVVTPAGRIRYLSDDPDGAPRA